MRSLWLEEALAQDTDVSPQLEERVRADVCIVGGGYTGLWTAIQLKEREPGCEVVLLEADICGGGASGRNGGFVMSWWSKFGSLKKLCGPEGAVRLCRVSAEAVSAIGRFCNENEIDADFRHDGWLWTATNRSQLGAWQSTLDELDHYGAHPFVELEPGEVARRTCSTAHIAGVYSADYATVQPALLARGLRKAALKRGVRIYEHSPMKRIERSRPATVLTPSGSVTAGRVVLAMNAWLARFREIQRALVIVASDMIATPPIPERLRALGWNDGVAISDSRLMVHYYRNTRDGRVAFGKGGGTLAFGGNASAFDQGSNRAAEVMRSFWSMYPSLADVPLARSWAGPIDRSLTGVPFFGRLDRQSEILYGAGYSGNGVGPAYLGGSFLSSMALGVQDEWTASPLTKGPAGFLPPEPVKYFGGLIVRAAVERKERREDSGNSPGLIATRIARLAPGGLVPLKGAD